MISLCRWHSWSHCNWRLIGRRSPAYQQHQRASRTAVACCLENGSILFPDYTQTHTRLPALCPGLPGWAGTRKVKPVWILLKQEIVSGSGISWAICKSAPRSIQITTPAPHHSVFCTGRMPFLPPSQQRQSTEGISTEGIYIFLFFSISGLQAANLFKQKSELSQTITDAQSIS